MGAAIALALACAHAAAAETEGRESERLVVHEWGTFTCLQDDKGVELPGINIDDEPVPEFVHNLAPFILSNSFLSNQHWRYRMKGAPRHHPQVTMRLETPVLYFHPPKGRGEPLSVDVRVKFRGVCRTEFYPGARAEAPGLRDGGFRFRDLTSQTVSQLAWDGVRVGTDGVGPETDEHVWLAPRKVAAANITAADGESERYLFYRGVGNLRAPLRLKRGASRDEIDVYSNFDALLGPGEKEVIPQAWLVEATPNGPAHFRQVGPFSVAAGGRPIASLTLKSLKESEGGLEDLVAAMHAALVKQGLFADEATAMLATWRRAYFQSPGLRLFFIVPDRWVSHYLPLELSVDARVERVMMARIELVTEQQRGILAQMAMAPASDPAWVERIPNEEAKDRFLAGRMDFGDLGLEIPRDYDLYLQLGRFRNALLVAEERARPNEALSRFIENYALTPFRAPPAGDAERSGFAERSGGG